MSDDSPVVGPGPSAIRSALLVVTDLDRSVAFYQEVLQLQPRVRDGGVVALGGETPTAPALFLRLANRRAAHPGRDAVGLRALTFEVGTPEELDRLERLLEARGALHDRHRMAEPEGFEFVRGQDPDRNVLVFSASPPGRPLSVDHYCQSLEFMYVLDA